MVTTEDLLPRRRRPAPRVRAVEVRDVVTLSPQMLRVTFGGPDLEGFEIAGPTGHLKLYLKQEGQKEIDLEALAAPRGERPPSAPISRTFTPRRFDAVHNLLDIEFYVHGEGPASSFAAAAVAGEVVAIAGPSRPYHLQEDSWQLIGGDETAFPAIGMIAEALPDDTAGVVLLEAEDPADFPELAAPANLSVRQLLRQPGAAGQAILDALGELELPAQTIQGWVAGESVAIRAARRILLERGIPATQLTTRGYWRYGEAGHPDHDMGED